jgi:integrase
MGRNGGKDARFAKDHVSDSGVQGVLQRTLKRLGFKKHVHPHVFRHYGERYKMVSDDSKPAKSASCSSIHSPFYH